MQSTQVHQNKRLSDLEVSTRKEESSDSKDYFRTACYLLLCLILLNGCSKKDIEGTVHDPHGKGIAGVSVQILKSTFRSTTDPNGRYSLDYIPGSFTIQFSKPDYTTHKLDLTLLQKSKFPAETITLYPIPRGKGFYLIGNSDLVQLPESRVMEEQLVGWPPSIRHTFRVIIQNKVVPSTKSGKILFIDTYASSTKLVQFQEGYIVQSYTSFFGDRKYDYDGILKDQTVTAGEEKLPLRIVKLEPGNYAWCEMVETTSGGIRPDQKLPCFPFAVLQSISGEK